MYGLNLKLVERFFVISKPYWFSEEKWRARGLFALLLVLLVLETQFNVRFNEQSGEFTSALAARDAPRFFRAMRTFLALLVFAVPIFAFYYYVRDKLAIGWRRWLSYRFLGKYFDNRAYYHLLGSPEIDNPDQRIADDIAAFTQKSLSLSMMFASSWFQVLAFGRV
ncbi:MAG TPA: hypothetical protein VFQ61_37065, partial [Polyangiaceae bacterium]|nr:hypothetical protein [Polyangiaceae bacterium]